MSRRGDIYWSDDRDVKELRGRMGRLGRCWWLLPKGVSKRSVRRQRDRPVTSPVERVKCERVAGLSGLWGTSARDVYIAGDDGVILHGP